MKLPEHNEWWVSNDHGGIRRVVGTKLSGAVICEDYAGWHSVYDDFDDWHHEPLCTSFNWQPPAPIDPGEGWELLNKGDVIGAKDEYFDKYNNSWFLTISSGLKVGEQFTCGAYRRRKPPAEVWPKYVIGDHWTDTAYLRVDSKDSYVAFTIDGAEREPSCYGALERLIENRTWRYVTKSEALARVKPAEPIDPGEGWELLVKPCMLQEGDQYKNHFGIWCGTNWAGRMYEDNDENIYRRRKPTAETWPKYYVRTSGADSWVYRADGRYTIRNLTCDCVAEPAEWYWRHGNMVEITESEALARVRPAEPIAADSIPDHRPARDVLMDVLEWLNPEDETSPTNVAAAVETIEQWLEDNPEPVEPIAHPVERTATPLVNAVVESPDDWVEITDPEHVLRKDVDYFYNWRSEWDLVKGYHGTKMLNAGQGKARCRRRDLPAPPAPQPKRTPVRLWVSADVRWGDRYIVSVKDGNPNPERHQEIKFDGSGFYVVEGD